MEGDFEWIDAQCLQFANFMGTRHSLFHPDKELRRHIFKSLMDDHLFITAIGAEDGEYMGFCAGVITPHMLNPDLKVLQEVFWWVAEGKRHSRAGLMLLRAFKEWGRQNVDWVFFSIQHNTPLREEALTRRGFRLQERFYLYEA
jgi:hypothetical protein